MFMDIIGIVNNLWFNGKMSWETKEKINGYIHEHADDEQLMDKLYKKGILLPGQYEQDSEKRNQVLKREPLAICQWLFFSDIYY